MSEAIHVFVLGDAAARLRSGKGPQRRPLVSNEPLSVEALLLVLLASSEWERQHRVFREHWARTYERLCFEAWQMWESSVEMRVYPSARIVDLAVSLETRLENRNRSGSDPGAQHCGRSTVCKGDGSGDPRPLYQVERIDLQRHAGSAHLIVMVYVQHMYIVSCRIGNDSQMSGQCSPGAAVKSQRKAGP